MCQVMFVTAPLAHNNIVFGIASKCYMFCCSFHPLLRFHQRIKWILLTSVSHKFYPLVTMYLPPLLVLLRVGMTSFI